MGKTGQGKSTAGNKLLGIDGTSTPRIKEWTCQTEKGLLKSSNTNDMLSFKAANSRESVTKQCQMLSNEDTHIRVLDVPGFGDSKSKENVTTTEVNAGFINAIIEVQEKMHVTYNRILYFLPFRGTPDRADGYFQDELQLLFNKFGKSIFQCMVIIATQEKKYQEYYFGSDDIESLSELIKAALKISTEEVLNIGCPPIIYLPLAACPEDVLRQIQMANVLNDCSVITARQSVPMYKGEDHWEEWIVKFEEVANDQFKDDDKAKLLFFKGRLTDNVKSMCLVTCLPTDDYRMVKQKVEEKLYLEVFCYKDIPEPYSGDGDETYWEQWIEHFEKRASQRKLDDQRKLQWLQARLVRGAQETVSKLSSNERQSYALVTKALKKQVYATCLEKRGKKSSEEIGDYAKSLLRLATCAYPDAPEQEREGKALSYLKPYLHSSIQSRKWKTVEEAIIVNLAVTTVDEQFTNDRSEGWDKWLEKFECKCKDCSLGNSNYLLWFESLLSGKAVECYATLPKQLKKDYQTAKNSFQTRLYKNSFDEKCKNKPVKGSVREWANELSDLVIKAYPDVSQNNRDGEVIKHILLATENHFSLKPESIKEAVNFVCAVEWIPNAFTGANGWCEWINKADKYLSHPGTGMAENEKVRCIQTRMCGNALELFRSLPQHQMCSFESAIAGFQETLFHHWLQCRTRKKTEGWDIYVEDLCSVGKRVYPKKKSETLVLNHMLSQVAEPHKSREWKSLNEAVNALMANELLPPYSNSEEEDWKMWKAKFENVIELRALNNEQKIIWLSSSLIGEIKQHFDKQHSLYFDDYDKAINLLETILYARRFHSRTKKQSETWEDFYTHLNTLAAEVYPSASAIDRAILWKIRWTIIKETICEEPVSAEDAVLIASAQESVPNTFSGTEDWETWITIVQTALQKNNIVDDAKRKRFLHVRLSGAALQFFNTVCSTSKTFQEILQSFETAMNK